MKAEEQIDWQQKIQDASAIIQANTDNIVELLTKLKL
jgi:hypothetical protein